MSDLRQPKVDNPGQAVIQKWEDVSCYTENIACHACKSTEKVRTGEIPDKVIDFKASEALTVGTAFWRLCEKCHFDGWMPPSSRFLGKFTYFKIYDRGAKILTV